MNEEHDMHAIEHKRLAGLTGGTRPAINDDITLSGDASEVDVQQTPKDRARIEAACVEMERLRRRSPAWAWLGVAMVCLCSGVAVIAIVEIIAWLRGGR